MRKYIFIVVFIILVLAGISLAGYCLSLGDKEGESFVFKVFTVLTGSGGLAGLIFQMSKKTDTKTTPAKIDDGVGNISGNGNSNISRATKNGDVYPTTNQPPQLPSSRYHLPNRNPHFSGRKEILENISKTFNSNEEIAMTQALTGLGGIGKTQIALKYAYQSKKDKIYDYILWVNAESDVAINKSFKKFALSTNQIGNEDKYEAEDIKRILHDLFDKTKNWLLVFDNAEDIDRLKEWCPPQNAGMNQHVLITSRYIKWDKLATVIRIGFFEKEEASVFLTKRSNKPRDIYQEKLAEKMGYLPLALDQAGAYMEINRMSYKDYLDLFNKYNLELLAEKYDDEPEKKTVATTWQISLNKINNPASKHLLNLFAFLAPDNICIQWFKDASDVLPDELREAASNELKYNKAVSDLTKYSLISHERDGSISIHRLVQQVIRESLKDEQLKWPKYCVNIFNELGCLYLSSVEGIEKFSYLMPYINSVLNFIGDDDATKEVAQLYQLLGCFFNYVGNYDKALEYYEKVLKIQEKISGIEHQETAAAINNIAGVYHILKNYGKASDNYKKALSIFLKVFGEENEYIAKTYNNIAAVLSKQSEYVNVLSKQSEFVNEAWEYYEKDLNICEKVLGTEHRDTATTYKNMAGVSTDCDIPLKYYEKALSIYKKVLGDEHPSTAVTYDNIAWVCKKKGDYQKALDFYNKLLTIHKKVLGEEHYFTAITYYNISEVYKSLKDFEKAAFFFGKFSRIFDKKPTDTHNYTPVVYFYLPEKGKELEYKLPAVDKNESKAVHPDVNIVYPLICLSGINPIPFKYDLKDSPSDDKVLSQITVNDIDPPHDLIIKAEPQKDLSDELVSP